MNDEKSFADYFRTNQKISIWKKAYWRIKRIKEFCSKTKYFFQKVFRSHHSSDIELWNLYSHLTKVIYKKLVAFKKTNRHGYPSAFSDYQEHEWGSKKEYDKAVKEGKILGGGPEAWEKILDEMIFAFEFLTYYDDVDYRKAGRKSREMLAKYGLTYPHEKIPENRKVSYVYTDDDIIMSSDLPPDDPDNKDRKFLGESVSYYNFDLEQKYYERAQKGLELFGKYFMSLWD